MNDWNPSVPITTTVLTPNWRSRIVPRDWDHWLSMQNGLVCDQCGAPMGTDGHIDVAEEGGKTFITGVRCFACDQKRASVYRLDKEGK